MTAQILDVRISPGWITLIVPGAFIVIASAIPQVVQVTTQRRRSVRENRHLKADRLAAQYIVVVRWLRAVHASMLDPRERERVDDLWLDAEHAIVALELEGGASEAIKVFRRVKLANRDFREATTSEERHEARDIVWSGVDIFIMLAREHLEKLRQ